MPSVHDRNVSSLHITFRWQEAITWAPDVLLCSRRLISLADIVVILSVRIHVWCCHRFWFAGASLSDTRLCTIRISWTTVDIPRFFASEQFADHRGDLHQELLATQLCRHWKWTSSPHFSPSFFITSNVGCHDYLFFFFWKRARRCVVYRVFWERKRKREKM